MQIQTTTITTETQNVFGQDFVINTFEQTISAYCDTCENQANGAKEVLKNRGWHLGQNEQFCPECNY